MAHSFIVSNINSNDMNYLSLIIICHNQIACVYVYSDFIMSKQTPPPLPARVCCYTGMYTSLLSIIWIAVYTVPHSEQLINIKQGTTLFEVIQMYILVMVSNSLHSWNYYELIDRTGSVCLIM